MTLSAPIYLLKRRARVLARNEGIPLHQALDRIARREGFATWSLLVTRAANRKPARTLLAELRPGDLLLLAARPGHGKTLLGIELMVEAMSAGHHGVFFSLDFGRAEIAEAFAVAGADPRRFDTRFTFDDSDDISAGYIIDRLTAAPPGTVVVVDYLQVLDRRRRNPELMDQVKDLRAFAGERGLIMVFISQIHRRYDPAERPCPGLMDVNLPNPLDLTLFSKACFLNNGNMTVTTVP